MDAEQEVVDLLLLGCGLGPEGGQYSIFFAKGSPFALESWFTPSAIERLRPRVQQLVDDVLDTAAERGSMELVDELAFTMPFQVISDLLDLPTDRSDDVRDWSQALTASLEPTADEAVLDAAERASQLMGEYVGDVIEHRRTHLGTDLLSALLQVEEQGDRLSTAELWSFVILLYVAGHETTVNLIGNGTLALLRHPDEMRRWAADPGMDGQAIDELVAVGLPRPDIAAVELEDAEAEVTREQRVLPADLLPSSA